MIATVSYRQLKKRENRLASLKELRAVPHEGLKIRGLCAKQAQQHYNRQPILECHPVEKGPLVSMRQQAY